MKKIIRRIGEEIAADPELGPDLLQPLKFQGVMAAADAGLVVRAKSMAKPTSAPNLIRREADNGILKAFAAEGIRFAPARSRSSRRGPPPVPTSRAGRRPRRSPTAAPTAPASS